MTSMKKLVELFGGQKTLAWAVASTAVTVVVATTWLAANQLTVEVAGVAAPFLNSERKPPLAEVLTTVRVHSTPEAAELGVDTPARISWIVSAASMGTVIGGYVFKRMRPLPVGTMLAIVFLGFGVGYVGVALAPNWIVGAPLDAVGQFAGGIAIPTLISWALARYPLEHRGRGMGFWGAAFFLGQFLNPPVMTAIFPSRRMVSLSLAAFGERGHGRPHRQGRRTRRSAQTGS